MKKIFFISVVVLIILSIVIFTRKSSFECNTLTESSEIEKLTIDFKVFLPYFEDEDSMANDGISQVIYHSDTLMARNENVNNNKFIRRILSSAQKDTLLLLSKKVMSQNKYFNNKYHMIFGPTPIYGAQLSINDTAYYKTLELPVPLCNGKFGIDSLNKNNENVIYELCNYLIELSPIKLYIYDRIINYDSIVHVVDYPIYGDYLTPEPIDSIIFTAVHEMPEYKGGNEALRRFIKNNIKYPESLRGSGIGGRVYVDVVVCRDGSITEAKIRKGVHHDIDQEALRVVNQFPRFKPGKQNNQPVNVRLYIAIDFKE